MLSPKQLADITYAKIHPAIGIARIGTSQTASFLAPEVPNPQLSLLNQPYRDGSGALVPQAVRFRIYGYKQVGGLEEVVGEITGQDAVINWTVHVANAKSAWFGLPGDLYHPLDLQPDVPFSTRISGSAAASEFIIDSGPVSLNSATGNQSADLKGWLGKNSISPAPLSVKLGTMSLNPVGELVFQGGTGLSGLMTNGFFANFDNMSDGSVDAAVTIGGQQISCAGAWVICCPPSFGPGLKAVRTLYDLLVEKSIAWGSLPTPAPNRIISFPDEIYPIFERLSRLQWTSQGFDAIFGSGKGKKYDLLDPQKLTSLRQPPLASGADPNSAWRQDVFQQFRKPGAPNNIPAQWPPLWGDTADDLTYGDDSVPNWNCSVSVQQWDALRLWASGQFCDVSQNPILGYSDFSQVPLAQQPAALDCASLSFVGADAFHPGLDVSWVIRIQDIYEPNQPFRIRRGTVQLSTVAAQSTITFNTAKSAGMFNGLVPGGLTCWMSVPWQCDLQGCASIDPRYGTKPMAWWPARVPDFVQRGTANQSRSPWYTLCAPGVAIDPQFLKKLGLVLATSIPGGPVGAPPIFIADR